MRHWRLLVKHPSMTIGNLYTEVTSSGIWFTRVTDDSNGVALVPTWKMERITDYSQMNKD